MNLRTLLCITAAFIHDVRSQQDEFSKCDSKCVFKEGTITSKNVGSFPKCAKVCSSLIINNSSGLTEKQLSTAFKNLKVLIGNLEIQNTNYKSASFLAGLQRIESATAGISITNNNEMLELGWKNLTTMIVNYFDVELNEKMKKLNLPKWKTLSCATKSCTANAYISNFYESKFCLTTTELKALSGPKVLNPSLYGKVCAPNASNKKVCTKPTAGCQEFVGNLNIGAKFDVKKVKSLKFLYGGLTIKGTNFTSLNFLSNLTRIVQLNNFKAAIEIQNNRQLKTVNLSSMKRILAFGWEKVVANKNHKALLNDWKSCLSLRSAMYPEESWSDMPRFDDWTCEEMKAGEKSNDRAIGGGGFGG